MDQVIYPFQQRYPLISVNGTPSINPGFKDSNQIKLVMTNDSDNPGKQIIQCFINGVGPSQFFQGTGNPTTLLYPSAVTGAIYFDTASGNTWVLEVVLGINTWIQFTLAGVSGATGATGASGTNGAPGVQGPPGTTNVPWADIQGYGAKPHANSFALPTAGCSTQSGSPNVTIASGTLSGLLTNGQGVCIWAAGPATSQSTPSAPTASSPGVKGSQTITYKCVGYDLRGGLTAASAAGTVTDAPAVFGPLPVAITSASVTSNVLTVNFASPLNNTVTAGMTIHIIGLTGAGATWNSQYTIASAPSTSQVTIALTTANGTATVSGATGRLSNSALITGISRASNGVVTVTTAQPHNFKFQNSLNPTVVLIEGVTEIFVGYFTIASVPTANTFTYNTSIYSAQTGALIGGDSGVATATVWEYIDVACPQLPAFSTTATIGYYIYSDSPNPGGGLVLVGKTVYGDQTWRDWGQTQGAGYVAPGYVPTTPPASAQNQMLATTIASGAGTTSLVLNANAGATIGALGATIMFDDGPNLSAAAAAAAGGIAGTVFISPPLSAINHAGYIFNSTLTLPEEINVVFGCHCIINETMTFTAGNDVTSLFGSVGTNSPGFGNTDMCDISGLGNPMMCIGEDSGNTGSVFIEKLCFTNSSNGTQAVVMRSSLYNTIHRCGFTATTNFGTAVGLLMLGSCSFTLIDSTDMVYTNRYGNNGVLGQSGWNPPIGGIWFRGCQNTNVPNGQIVSSNITIKGKHSWYGRGMLFDQMYASFDTSQAMIQIGDMFWVQQALTPTMMFWGQLCVGIDIHNILNDTSQNAVLGNLLYQQMKDVYLYNSSVSLNAGLVTGNPITNLFVSGSTPQYTAQLQRVTISSLVTTTATSESVFVPNYPGFGSVTLIPTNVSAATDVAAGLAFIVSKGVNSVTVQHSATANMTFDVMATIGND